MVERAQAKRALERLVVHKDKFKSDSLKLPKQKGGVNVVEMMKVLLEEDQVAASCTAGKRAGLEQEVLESILDRTNIDHFEEKIKLADGKAAAQIMKEKKEAQKVRAEKKELERKSANKFGSLKEKSGHLFSQGEVTEKGDCSTIDTSEFITVE